MKTQTFRYSIVTSVIAFALLLLGAQAVLGATKAPTKKECRTLELICKKDLQETQKLNAIFGRFGMLLAEPQSCVLHREACSGDTQCAVRLQDDKQLLQCATCGDGLCEGAEQCRSSNISGHMQTADCGPLYCPQDCKPKPVCGNNICEDGEASTSDPGGCGPNASPECLGPPTMFYLGTCPQDCAPKNCPTDVFACPDGTILNRNPLTCQFPSCSTTGGDPLSGEVCPPLSNDPPPANCKYEMSKDNNGCDIREMICWMEPQPEVVCPPLSNDPIPANCRYEVMKDNQGCEVQETVCWMEPQPPPNIPINRLPFPCPIQVLAEPPAGCSYHSTVDENGCSVPELICRNELIQACPMFALAEPPTGCIYIYTKESNGCSKPELLCRGVTPQNFLAPAGIEILD